MSEVPGKFHVNILVDSLQRQPGGSPWDFQFTLNKTINIPMRAQAFLTCTRWSIDTSKVPLRSERSGKALQLIITELAGSRDVIDMGRGGVNVPCLAYIPTIDNGRNVARTTSSTSHPIQVASGANIRSFRCQVRDIDGNIADLKDGSGSGGEWEADLLIVMFTG